MDFKAVSFFGFLGVCPELNSTGSEIIAVTLTYSVFCRSKKCTWTEVTK